MRDIPYSVAMNNGHDVYVMPNVNKQKAIENENKSYHVLNLTPWERSRIQQTYKMKSLSNEVNATRNICHDKIGRFCPLVAAEPLKAYSPLKFQKVKHPLHVTLAVPGGFNYLFTKILTQAKVQEFIWNHAIE